MLLDIARGRGPREEAVPYRKKLRLHAQTVGGGVVGVLLCQSIGNSLLFAAAR